MKSSGSISLKKRFKIFFPLNLEELINEFNKHYQFEKDPHIVYCKEAYEKGGIEKLVEAAILSDDDRGKMNSHQWRIGKTKLKEFLDVWISRIDYTFFENASSFEEIYQLIENQARQMHGIGELAAYDIALRIAYCLGKYPNEVYLHRGAKDGARNLLKRKRISGRYLPMSVFPDICGNYFKCHELEVFLCVCKDPLKRLPNI